MTLKACSQHDNKSVDFIGLIEQVQFIEIYTWGYYIVFLDSNKACQMFPFTHIQTPHALVWGQGRLLSYSNSTLLQSQDTTYSK